MLTIKNVNLFIKNKLIFKKIVRIYGLKSMILRTIKKYFFLPLLLFIAHPAAIQGFVTHLLEFFSIISSRSQGPIISLKIPLNFSHINCEQSQYVWRFLKN